MNNMLDLLVTLVIILLIVIAIIMAIDKWYGRAGRADRAGRPAKKVVSDEETQVRKEIELPDILEIKETLPSVSSDTKENLQRLISVCEAVYEGRGNTAEINAEVARIARAEGLGDIGMGSSVQYNCSNLIAKLRERM